MQTSTIHIVPTERRRVVPTERRRAGSEFTIQEFILLADACYSLRSWGEFSHTALTHARRILFHDVFACAIVRMSDMHVHNMSGTGLPDRHVDVFAKRGETSASQLVEMWCTKKEPIVVTRQHALENANQPWSQAFLGLHLSALGIHGLIDINHSSAQATIFFFGLISSPLSDGELAHRLTLTVPFLQAGLSNVVCFDKSSICDEHLSAREIEVIKWIYYGKTNKEIGIILNISQYTVKNHVQNIIIKLGVSNRAHAVGKEINLGLLTEA